MTDDSSEGPISYYVYPKAYLSHFQIPPFGRWLTNNHRSMADALPPLPADARILEVGSGPGQFTRQLARSYPKANIVAIDSSRGMVRFSRRDGTPDNVEFRITDFRDVEGVYDLIVGSGCWEFLPLDRCIDQIERLLAPDGVAVINTIGPTFILTPMTRPFFENEAFRDDALSRIPMGKLGELEDIMGAVVFLSSPAAAMITGAALTIDGGWTAW